MKMRVTVAAALDIETAKVLERLARERNMRVGTLVRQILERYTTARTPLIEETQHERSA